MTPSYECHDSPMSVHTNPTWSESGNESYHTYEWGTSHIWMARVVYMNESCHT